MNKGNGEWQWGKSTGKRNGKVWTRVVVDKGQWTLAMDTGNAQG